VDTADLYDWEVQKVSLVWKSLMDRFSHKPNTKRNLQELATVAHAEFLEAGFVVNVVWENALMVDPNTMESYPIAIEVMGRAPGAKGADHATDGFDHERKRHEVLAANIRNERFYGEKESNKG